LFDLLISAKQYRWRYGKAERRGGLAVHDHLEFCRKLHRKIARPLAAQDAIHIGSGTTVAFYLVDSVGEQAAVSGKGRQVIDRRYVVSGRRRYDRRAMQRETRTIPIVFANVGDPVASGLVARLDRPGGNVTGFASLEATLGGKWLALLSEIAPGLKRTAFMFNPDMAAGSAYMPSLETAARSLKVVPIAAPVHSDAEIETAVMALAREPGGGLVVMPDAFMIALNPKPC
jgi:hypothetical protein